MHIVNYWVVVFAVVFPVAAGNTCINFTVYYETEFTWQNCPAESDGYLEDQVDSPLAGFPYTVPSSAVTDEAVLPASDENLLLTLSWIDAADCSLTPVSRSYEGFDWEGIPPISLQPNCTNVTSSSNQIVRECTILTRSTDEGVYRVDATISDNVSAADLAGRFLLQTTFGPTTEEIDDVIGGSGRRRLQTANTSDSTAAAQRWIENQMQLPATLHRSHLRRHTNPRIAGGGEASKVGTLATTCDDGTRWHRNAFTVQDIGKKMLVVPVNNTESGCFMSLRVENIVRAEVESFDAMDCSSSSSDGKAYFTYLICDVEEKLDYYYDDVDIEIEYKGPYSYNDATASCDDAVTAKAIPHPMIHFFEPDSDTTQLYSSDQIDLTEAIKGTKYSHYLPTRPNCSGASKQGQSFIGVSNMINTTGVTYFKFDSRRILVRNTLKHPANISTAAEGSCPTVERNFVNEHSCIHRSPSDACSVVTFDAGASLVLDTANIRSWFSDSLKYVYYVLNLEMDDVVSPCTVDTTSRWVRHPGTCAEGSANALDNETATIITAALRSYASVPSGLNLDIRDIRATDFSGSATCNTSASTVAAKLNLDGDCWEHVHPNLYNVYDFSQWIVDHPGTPDALAGGRRDPIRRFAQEGLAYIVYPSWHPMVRWEENFELMLHGTHGLLGRLNDTVDYSSLPQSLQTVEMAERIGAAKVVESVEACGSRGEVANNNELGARFLGTNPDLEQEQGLDRRYLDTDMGPTYTFQSVVMAAKDQLRQRVAWALSQIIVVAKEQSDSKAEPMTSFYDIFVANAFGNYRDILREVSAAPVMARYLTYYANSAFSADGKYPDENYARELMQLFTIGVWELNDDGTAKRNPSTGQRIPTYNNDNIMNAARVWTGWYHRPSRGNLIIIDEGEANRVDPMYIRPDKRDRFPKTKLRGGYLGDGVQLCSNLPPRHFLKSGARYVLNGFTSQIGSFYDNLAAGNGSHARSHFSPDNQGQSELYDTLCDRSVSNGKCSFPPVVTLTSTLTCHGNVECQADTLRTVQINDDADNTTMYYTYEEPPCVHMMFFGDGRTLLNRNTRQCADPEFVAIGGNACCNADGDVVSNGGEECLYLAEPMKHSSAAERCDAIYNATLCPFVWNRKFGGQTTITRDENTDGSSLEWANTCSGFQYYWISDECKLRAQVNSLGRVVLHDPVATTWSMKHALGGSGNVFEVEWNAPTSGGIDQTWFPVIENGTYCNTMGCEYVPDWTGNCLCDVHVNNSAVIVEMVDPLLSAADLRDFLFIGASDPDDHQDYTLCTSTWCTSQPDVAVYVVGGSSAPSSLTIDTIFKLTDAPGRRSLGRFLKNELSTVIVGNKMSPYSFRNPPNYNPNVGAYARTLPNGNSLYELYGYQSREPQALHESDAWIDHLFEHDNMAPFLATRLIQRLVTSNPSPRYVKAVVKAFKSGAYDGKVFSGKYGDLAATISAILLDREARSPLLDSDPRFGQLREPLLKVMHMMRSMDYQSKDGVELALARMGDKVGQGSFQQPSVFSFYQPDFAPDGPVGAAGLVSPEGQLDTGPYLMSYLNGMDSLIEYGLTNCQDGFGDSKDGSRKRKSCNTAHLTSATDGAMTYALDNTHRHVEFAAANCSASLQMSPLISQGCHLALNGQTGPQWRTKNGNVGAWITLEVAEGSTALINGLRFSNRCSDRSNKGLRLEFSDGSQQTVELADGCSTETFALSLVETSYVRIVVESVHYSGSEHNGARIIEFYHNDTMVPIVACTAISDNVDRNCPDAVVDRETEWAVQGEGVGSWVQWNGIDAPEIGGMIYSNDCDFNRNKEIRLEFSDGSNQMVTLEDVCGVQWVSFISVSTTFIRLTVESVYNRTTSPCCSCSRPRRMTSAISNMETSMCEGTGIARDVETDFVPEVRFFVKASQQSIVDDLAVLLAPGRLTHSTRNAMADTISKTRTIYGEAQALKDALKLFSVAPEFHATNKPSSKTKSRSKAAEVVSQNRPYKAIVVVMLHGGADSYSMVVPHSNCTIARDSTVEHDLYQEYYDVRGENVGLLKESLLPIDIMDDSAPQPCKRFGLHPSLTYLQDSYVNAKDTIVFGNVGGMAEPMTREEFYSKSKLQPQGNFGHDAMRRAASSLDAVNKEAKGVLGRMIKKVSSAPQRMKSAMYSTAGKQKILEGSSTPLIVKPVEGVMRYSGYQKMKGNIEKLNKKKSRSIFAETFSSSLETALESTESLGALLSEQSVVSDAAFTGKLGDELKEAAKLIAIDTTKLATERAGYFVEQRGFDTHNSADITEKMDEFDASLEAFATEMKALGLWNNITLLVVSDFGRTLTDNSLGTDHGWGGNYFMQGGEVRGGRMLGKYPNRLTEEHCEVGVGRGRTLPTTPWEFIWNGLAEWWDISEARMDDILPRAKYWQKEELFTRSDLFN
eukprot:CAMPEP_0114421664 /NCGR_PEP_ID=MMETSP0103-20121206/5199_1 /TAXON_ID=37642 ORGANISM="Paraphysomonas imperforata, Strain PA2" /NCGR_SAMPLE_ID=MMETSP0103 /ASSEMBLY_ACC=CAM_ASM_000201 /LENGTH=2411 /DNA_ID=CAMNT_0001590201 /DNA_START=27 /DNA_END=7262 /DNA_ORIENTATION=+